MAAKKKRQPTPTPELPKIYEAALASGPSGAVLKGAEIDQGAAVVRRQAGENIVVCGNSLAANRNGARAIEAVVGPYERQDPHDELAGPLALPHFQQQDRSRKGHSFYETDNHKARTNA
jgi:hypothetical protein